MKKELHKRVTVLLLCMLLMISSITFFGCGRQANTETESGLMYDTLEQFLAVAEIRYPMTDDQLRYTLYDVCAVVTECLTRDEIVTIPATIEGVPVVGIAKQAFYQNGTMKKLIIGSNVLYIDEEAFAECSALTTVQMSGSVNTINQGAFRECVRLKSVIIPAAVDTISTNTFSGCENLKKAIIESRTASTKEKIKSKSTTRSIQEGAFANCESLVALWVPMDIKEINDSILAGERKTAVYGEEKSAAARFAAAQRLDYGVTTRDSFDASVRTYNPFEEDVSAAEAGKTKVNANNFIITFNKVNYYKQMGNLVAGEDMTLMEIEFEVKNNDVITRNFDGFNVACKSCSRNQEGVIMPYLKRPHYFLSELGIKSLNGSIPAYDTITGSIVIEVNTKMEYASIFFDGADDVFYIK